MKRIWLNIRYIAELSVKYTEVIYALLGFIGMFVPLSDIFYAEITLIKRIVVSCCILLGTWMIVFGFPCDYPVQCFLFYTYLFVHQRNVYIHTLKYQIHNLT